MRSGHTSKSPLFGYSDNTDSKLADPQSLNEPNWSISTKSVEQVIRYMYM